MDVIAAGGSPAGQMTAALLAAAAVRAEVRERGCETTRQSRGTPMHTRTLDVLTMLGAGDGRRISDLPLIQGQRARTRTAPGRQPGLELAATRTDRPDSHATHRVTVIPAVN